MSVVQLTQRMRVLLHITNAGQRGTMQQSPQVMLLHCGTVYFSI
jgi:hypothetical protein